MSLLTETDGELHFISKMSILDSTHVAWTLVIPTIGYKLSKIVNGLHNIEIWKWLLFHFDTCVLIKSASVLNINRQEEILK